MDAPSNPAVNHSRDRKRSALNNVNNNSNNGLLIVTNLNEGDFFISSKLIYLFFLRQLYETQITRLLTHTRAMELRLDSTLHRVIIPITLYLPTLLHVTRRNRDQHFRTDPNPGMDQSVVLIHHLPPVFSVPGTMLLRLPIFPRLAIATR